MQIIGESIVVEVVRIYVNKKGKYDIDWNATIHTACRVSIMSLNIYNFT